MIDNISSNEGQRKSGDCFNQTNESEIKRIVREFIHSPAQNNYLHLDGE
jgi:hypothetical protein